MVGDKKRTDFFLLGVVIILLVFGFLALFSTSAPVSKERFGNIYYFLNHQLLFGFLPGIILGFLAYKTPLYFFKKWVPILLLFNLFFLGLVFSPKIGLKLGGSSRWVILGPISFQPSEFLKLTFILYLAAWLNNRMEEKKIKKENQIFTQTFFAFVIIIGVIALFLILQPDIGTLGIILVTAVMMYFFAKTPLWHNILIILVGIFFFLVIIKLAPYRLARIMVFLNPETDPMGIGYQVKQALITIGSGGIFGSGLGLSPQKFSPLDKSTFLPHSISDAIFASLAQETGFVGSFVLVLLFFLFCWRGFRIGMLSEDNFLKLAALGITLWITIQSFVNIGSMIGILPLTGVPLPFISYGGSALVSELIGIGILLNISKHI